MTESFDAVLAEMRECCLWPRMGHTGAGKLKALADRLAAAHAAEVGELRDRLISASCYERLCDAELSASRARAEAANARADAAMGLATKWLEEAKTLDEKAWDGRQGIPRTDSVSQARLERAAKLLACANELQAALAQQALAGGERKDG